MHKETDFTRSELQTMNSTLQAKASDAVREVATLRSRLDDAEAVLKLMKCPKCDGGGRVCTRSDHNSSTWEMCYCKDGLCFDASAYFERWK